MWCEIDKTNLPIIKVNFSNDTQIESEFDFLLEEWMKLYDDKQDFYFIFDTRNLSSLNIKYAYRISSFIKKLKKLPYQYLKKSIIIVKNSYITFLLNLVFSITLPVADVYLFSNHTDIMITEDIESIKTLDTFNQVLMDYKNKFTYKSCYTDNIEKTKK